MSLTDSSFNLESVALNSQKVLLREKDNVCVFAKATYDTGNRVLINQRHNRLWRGATSRFKVKTFLITY